MYYHVEIENNYKSVEEREKNKKKLRWIKGYEEKGKSKIFFNKQRKKKTTERENKMTFNLV